MPEIAVVGSLNLDTTIRVPRLPAPGETVLGTGHFDDTGGKGANQAVAAARLGRSVTMVGLVGDDAAGRRLLASLETDGVDVSGIGTSAETPTGMAVITVDEAGENSIVVDPAANAAFDPSRLEPGRGAIESASAVLLQLEIPLDTVVAAVAMATGTVILNPAPAARLPARVLDRVDVFVPNATELAAITGGHGPATPHQAIEAARQVVGPATTVVTLGRLGAVVVSDGAGRHIPAPKVEAVDPTAAGDAFCGGLADALVRGMPVDEAVEWAVLCGAVAATRWGAQSSLPTHDDVRALKEAG